MQRQSTILACCTPVYCIFFRLDVRRNLPKLHNQHIIVQRQRMALACLSLDVLIDVRMILLPQSVVHIALKLSSAFCPPSPGKSAWYCLEMPILNENSLSISYRTRLRSSTSYRTLGPTQDV